MMIIIDWLYQIAVALTRAITRHRVCKMRKISRKLYPDEEDRALALIAEGVSLIEIHAMSLGETLKQLVVLPYNESEEGGYHVVPEYASDEYEYEYDEEDDDELKR
jgi:hypothetical protein